MSEEGGERLDLFGIGTGDPGDGEAFAEAFSVGRVLALLVALVREKPVLFLAAAATLAGLEIVVAVLAQVAQLAFNLSATPMQSPLDWQLFALIGLMVVMTVCHRVLREFLEAGVVTAMCQVAWQGAWTPSALLFAVGPAVRRMLVQVVGMAVLALPAGVLASITGVVAWATFLPAYQGAAMPNMQQMLAAGLITLVVGTICFAVYSVLWCVVWVFLQPAIVAATVDMNPFAAVGYSVQQVRGAPGPVVLLNAVYALILVPAQFLLLASSGCSTVAGAVSMAGPLALLHVLWLAGTAGAWLAHARPPEHWQSSGALSDVVCRKT